MRTIITGSRNIWDYQILIHALDYWAYPITAVLSPRQTAADRLGERYARDMARTLVPFVADYTRLGPGAGGTRNKLMVNDADAAIILWDGHSPEYIASLMDEQDKPYLVHISQAGYR